MYKLAHIKELDGLRAIAILLVCIAHFYQVDEATLYIDNKLFGIITFKISQLGLKGVELFFILSGYLITRILLNTKDSPNYFKSFYMRRILRIFPLYYFVLFVSFFILPYFISIDAGTQQIIDSQWKLWTYTSNVFFIDPVKWDISSFPNFGHFWSLAVEEHFYIVWPFIIYYFRNKKVITIMWLIFLFSMLSWILGFSESIFNWTTLKYSGALALGGILAYYEYQNIETLEKLYTKTKRYTILLLLLFLISAFIPRSFGEFGTIAGYVISLVLFSNLVLMAIFGNQKIKTFFDHKILFFIGKISYGIYIYHGLLRPYFKEFIYDPMYVLVGGGILTSIIYTVLMTMISIFIAFLSWEFFEKHFLQLKKYFNY
jgi:peptidoglycan/LPS O-acetylase OafA/YrhL